MSDTDTDAGEQERIIVLAEQIRNLLMFSALLIPDIDLLERVAQKSANLQGMAATMAPVLGAVGLDWEEKEFEAKLHRRRADALLQLVRTVRDTEDDRAKFKESQAAKANAAITLSKIFG